MAKTTKYPHYTFNGCHWTAFLSPTHTVQVHDGLEKACGINAWDPVTFSQNPNEDDVPTTKAAFMEALKRTQQRMALQLAGKDDSHLERP